MLRYGWTVPRPACTKRYDRAVTAVPTEGAPCPRHFGQTSQGQKHELPRLFCFVLPWFFLGFTFRFAHGPVFLKLRGKGSDKCERSGVRTDGYRSRARAAVRTLARGSRCVLSDASAHSEQTAGHRGGGSGQQGRAQALRLVPVLICSPLVAEPPSSAFAQNDLLALIVEAE